MFPSCGQLGASHAGWVEVPTLGESEEEQIRVAAKGSLGGKGLVAIKRAHACMQVTWYLEGGLPCLAETLGPSPCPDDG